MNSKSYPDIIGLTALGLIAFVPVLVLIPPSSAYDELLGILEVIVVGLIFMLGETWGLLYWRQHKTKQSLLAFGFTSLTFLLSFWILILSLVSQPD